MKRRGALRLQLRLFMEGMLLTKFTILFYFEFLGMRLFVFRCVVVPSSTLFTRKVNNLSHGLPFRDGAKAPKNYSMILLTTPAPTVRPPSRIANRVPSSRAIGAISSALILTLSPGITISTPSGRVMVPVTSVVRT